MLEMNLKTNQKKKLKRLDLKRPEPSGFWVLEEQEGGCVGGVSGWAVERAQMGVCCHYSLRKMICDFNELTRIDGYTGCENGARAMCYRVISHIKPCFVI